VKLLNQISSHKHCSGKWAFDDDIPDDIARRVIDDDRAAATGYPDFMSSTRSLPHVSTTHSLDVMVKCRNFDVEELE